jgi:ParB family chromosome partitioning protein
MAKKKDEFDFTNYLGGGDALSAIVEGRGAQASAPSDKEIELLNTTDGTFKDVPVNQLIEYSNHTFSIRDDDQMAILVDSITDFGVITPLIVRQISPKKYEILSGHRRTFAAKKAGLDTVPCKVVDVDDDMADIIAVDTNMARESIPISEKAKSYKVRYDAAFRMGKKKMEIFDEMANDASDSTLNIRRYLKLAELNPVLLNDVDEDRIPFTAGVILASLSEQHQKVIADVLSNVKEDISIKTAENLKTAAARGLTEEKAEAIICGKTEVRKTTAAPKKKAANIFAKVSSSDKDYLLSYSVEHSMSIEDVISKCVEILKSEQSS